MDVGGAEDAEVAARPRAGLPGLGAAALRAADRSRHWSVEHEPAVTAVEGTVLREAHVTPVTRTRQILRAPTAVGATHARCGARGVLSRAPAESASRGDASAWL